MRPRVTRRSSAGQRYANPGKCCACSGNEMAEISSPVAPVERQVAARTAAATCVELRPRRAQRPRAAPQRDPPAGRGPPAPRWGGPCGPTRRSRCPASGGPAALPARGLGRGPCWSASGPATTRRRGRPAAPDGPCPGGGPPRRAPRSTRSPRVRSPVGLGRVGEVRGCRRSRPGTSPLPASAVLVRSTLTGSGPVARFERRADPAVSGLAVLWRQSRDSRIAAWP